MSSPFQSIPAPHPEMQACVILPARNEADYLESTLAALTKQVDVEGRTLDPNLFEVLLLINDSTDGSLAIANKLQRFHRRFHLHTAECHFARGKAHIGHVRKLLMDLACERLLARPHTNSLILSTDADTEVAPDWIAQNREETMRGAEAVGGRISLRVPDFFRLNSKTRNIQHWDDRYQILLAWLEDSCDPLPHDRWPRHHQHFGGSFAVKPGIYRKVGGLPPMRALEDVAFYHTLLRYDVKVRHSPAVKVYTSGRLRGRTDAGLAKQLSRWNEGSAQIFVPSVELSMTFFALRHRLRTLWVRAQSGAKVDGAVLKSLAKDTGSSLPELHQVLSSRWFGAGLESFDLWRRLEHNRFQGAARQSLQHAVAELEARANQPRQEARFAAAARSDIAAL